MPSRTRNALVTLLAACLAGGGLGCGGDDEPAPGTTAPTAPPAGVERQPAPPPKMRSNVTVEEKDSAGNPVRFSGTDARGKAFHASIGDDASVPEDFPSDLAPYPGATTMATMSAADEATLVTYKTTDSQSDVFSFYKGQLEEKGWTIGEEKNFRGQLVIDATRESKKVTITVAGTSGDARISVVVQTVQ